MRFPEQARRIMGAVPAPENQPASEWEAMRKRHHLGDKQIRAGCRCGRRSWCAPKFRR